MFQLSPKRISVKPNPWREYRRTTSPSVCEALGYLFRAFGLAHTIFTTKTVIDSQIPPQTSISPFPLAPIIPRNNDPFQSDFRAPRRGQTTERVHHAPQIIVYGMLAVTPAIDFDGLSATTCGTT